MKFNDRSSGKVIDYYKYYNNCNAGSYDTFRPLIRIKELDLFCTTSAPIKWWNEDKKEPNLRGLIALIVLMMGATSYHDSSLGLCSTAVDTLMKSGNFKWPTSQWNDVYEKSEKKYSDNIYPKDLESSASKKGHTSTRAEDVTEEDHVSEESLAKLDEFLR